MSFLIAAKSILHPLGWTVLVICGLLGLLALASPRLFERVASTGSRWIDTDRMLALLDKRYDVDHYILPFSRVLGALVVASVAVLSLLLYRH